MNQCVTILEQALDLFKKKGYRCTSVSIDPDRGISAMLEPLPSTPAEDALEASESKLKQERRQEDMDLLLGGPSEIIV